MNAVLRFAVKAFHRDKCPKTLLFRSRFVLRQFHWQWRLTTILVEPQSLPVQPALGTAFGTHLISLPIRQRVKFSSSPRPSPFAILGSVSGTRAPHRGTGEPRTCGSVLLGIPVHSLVRLRKGDRDQGPWEHAKREAPQAKSVPQFSPEARRTEPSAVGLSAVLPPL